MTNTNTNIAWIDTETTGLDPNADQLLEVACIITDPELKKLAVFSSVIHYPKEVVQVIRGLATPLVQEMHDKTGLWQRVIKAGREYTRDQVDERLREFLLQFGAPGVMPIAGNTIGFDAKFMQSQLPASYAALNYRMIDVSSIAELAKRWYPEIPKLEKRSNHTALTDIAESIRELQHYREVLFK